MEEIVKAIVTLAVVTAGIYLAIWMTLQNRKNDEQDQINEWVVKKNIEDGYTPATLEILETLREIERKL